MKRFVLLLILCTFLLIISNCQRYINLFKCSFTGGEVVYTNTTAACPYMCSLAVYDEFQTAAFFDILWLTEPVRRLYIDLIGLRDCLSPTTKAQMVEHELKKLEECISFYLLVPARDCDLLATACDVVAPWKVYLRVDGKCYQPECIEKVCNLPNEYVFIFRDRFSKYRIPYKINFDARNSQGLPIINNCTKCVEFVITSLYLQTSCIWKKRDNCWVPICC